MSEEEKKVKEKNSIKLDRMYMPRLSSHDC